MSLDFDPKKDQLNRDGKESNLARIISAPQAADHLANDATLHSVSGSQNFRPYYREHRDVEARNAVKFGQKAVFDLGNEGYGLIDRVEVCVKLPKVGDSAAAAATSHPDDAGYGGAGTFMQWQPNMGELMLGGLDGSLRWKHGTETIRSYTPEQIHVKRRLCMDNEGSSKRAVYENSILRLPQTTQNEQYLYIPLWTPWGVDDSNLHGLFPAHAVGVPLTIEADIPSLGQLIQSDVAAANLRVVSSGAFDTTSVIPEIFLRVHYIVTTVAERVAFANLTNQPGGLRYKVLHSLSMQKQLTSTRTAHQFKIDLNLSQNPCVFTVAFVRFQDDTKAVGDNTAEDNDSRGLPRAVGGVIQRPDWTRFLPIDSWHITDGSQQITPTFSSGYYANSAMGHCSLFPSSPPDDLAVISFSHAPIIENHGMGHTNFSASHKPQFVVNLPAIDDALEGAAQTSREIVVMTFERNHFAFEAGQITLDYHGTTSN